ncbi:MAG: hypothetical protein LBR84_11095 [Tannerella sp.]|jgi:hypothetical protein|nr:hypothetical protein [Tannerella sp.]
MKNIELKINEKFVEILRTIEPEKVKLVSLLCELIECEKLAVYRRLRSDMPFTFAEIVKISMHIGISLDRIAGISDQYRSQPYNMFWQDYFNLTDVDYNMSGDYIKAINFASKCPHSEIGIAMTTLPLHAMVNFPNLYRLYILKSLYQLGSPNEPVPYSGIVIPSRMINEHKLYNKAVREIAYTYVIMDEYILETYIRDVKYFQSIRLISKNEIDIIKRDLLNLINCVEKIATFGAYDNGKEVDLYVTGLTFETTYTYIYSDSVTVSMVDAFTTGSMASVDKDACDHIRKWLRSMKRTSTMISSSEKNRIMYFDKQRSIVENML